MDLEFKYLVEVIQTLSSAHTLNDIMKAVRTAARKIAGADGATFVIRDQDYCFYADEDAIGPLWKGKRFLLRNCISGWSMLNKQPVVVPDIYSDDRIPLDAYATTFVKSLAITPVRKENPIAAIGTYWSQLHTPTSRQLELLQALADTVSVAMKNVELFSALEKRLSDLKAAADAKDEFLMILSHELRTPLTSVLGWSEILHEESAAGSDLKLTLETIIRNARSQMKIIDDLIDTSQIVQGRMKINMMGVDVVSLLEKVIEDAQLEASKKKITIQYTKEVPKAIILADPDRITQIFNNLLSNAIKFSDRSQTVSVVVHVQGPSLYVRVKDEGIGIAPDFIPHIFERFSRSGSFLSREQGGLGLGLAIVHHLTQSHSGEVWVDSEGIGKGATFSLAFPLLDSAAVNDTSSHIDF